MSPRTVIAGLVLATIALSGGCSAKGTDNGPRPAHTLVLRMVLPGSAANFGCPAQAAQDASSIVAVADPQGVCYQLSPVLMTLHWPISAEAQRVGPTGNWSVDITLTSADGDQFLKVARANIRAVLAIVLDGKVLSAPTIQPDLVSNFDSKIEITGAMDESAAEGIAAAVRSLPPG